MRRRSIFLLIGLILVLVAGVAAGCGDSAPAPAGGDESPEAILQAAIDSSQTVTSGSGDFEVTIKVTPDSSTTSSSNPLSALLAQPITVSGTFAASGKPEAVDATVKLTLAGQPLDVGFRSVDQKVWVNLGNQWYEAPAEVTDAMKQSTAGQPTAEQVWAILTELGIEPMTWLKDLQLAGTEKLDNVDTYHLTGTPDMAKIMTDLMALMQSQEFMSLIDPSGAMSSSAGSMMPSADELQELQTQMGQIFQNLKIDLWVDKTAKTLHKTMISLHAVPPAGEETGGVSAIDVGVTVNLKNVNQAVNVQAPSGAKPFADLEKALQENPEQILGPLGGLFSMMGSGMGGFESGTDGISTSTSISN